ncbi:GNAT family N-acetyltransferase [Gorillibacterium timonense]|uniref:GNAT family N-acetyltransferase n=1 Tax=Gorillibacterium timonense TaxID=1689269 RepID=UPI00071C8205|nr:GNAT family protein [Gorillibacterium timonense]
MGNPYAQFPHIVTDTIILRKIEETDIEGLFEIYTNENVFMYIPGDRKKNKAAVQNMIGHFERDFHKRKVIFLGIYLPEAPNEIVGVAEIFDYDDKVNQITIGYRLNERYWGKGIATQTVRAMVEYLYNTLEINRIQAFVMPANERSQNVLQKNNFVKEGIMRQSQYWTGIGVVDLTMYSLLRSEFEPVKRR